MKIIKIVGGLVQSNTYVLTDDGVNAIVIDPGDDEQKVLDALKENHLKCNAVLLTHAHFDHANGAKSLKIEHGALIYLHKKEVLLVNSAYNLASKFGKAFNSFNPDVLLKDGQGLDLCGIKIQVLHTPGHTQGSCCFIINNVIFSGDTLFNLSIGRTDFPTGSVLDMKKSLKKLFSLKYDYSVFPGHGVATKLFFERDNNPYA